MTLATDFRSASRSVRRGGWLSATVVLILAVAIGAVTAIFSIAHAVLIRPLPVVEPGRVMLLRRSSPSSSPTFPCTRIAITAPSPGCRWAAARP